MARFAISDIIKNNPDKDWDWENISYNINITLKIIKDNLYKPWHFDIISYRDFCKDINDIMLL